MSKNRAFAVNLFFSIILISLIIFSLITVIPLVITNQSIVGTSIEPFTVRTTNSELISLNDIDTPFILFFWASWCDPCRKLIPTLTKIGEKYREELLIVGINHGESINEINNYSAGKDIQFPLVYDEDSLFSSKFNIKSLPTLILVDKDKIIKKVSIGNPIFLRFDVDKLVEKNQDLSNEE